MISQRWRYNGRGSVVMRFLTSSPVKCAAARVILAISSPFLLASSPPLFYHSSRFSIRGADKNMHNARHDRQAFQVVKLVQELGAACCFGDMLGFVNQDGVGLSVQECLFKNQTEPCSVRDTFPGSFCLPGNLPGEPWHLFLIIKDIFNTWLLYQ